MILRHFSNSRPRRRIDQKVLRSNERKSKKIEGEYHAKTAIQSAAKRARTMGRVERH